MTRHEQGPDRAPWRTLPEGMADYLDLEARLAAPIRKIALDRVALALDAVPSQILDLGSGTGADAVELARRFPSARAHALDVSAELLDRTASAAAEAGVSQRVEGHLLDLNHDWTADIPAGVDVAWAALSLHHVADPTEVLRRVFATLRPGGVFVLIELTGRARFEPEHLGIKHAGLEDRIVHALSQSSHARADWSDLLTKAGFEALEVRECDFTARADTVDGARYMKQQLRAQRERLAQELTGDELVDLDTVIDGLQSGTSPLSFVSGRAVWIGVRPVVECSDRSTASGALEQATSDTRTDAAPPSLDADVAVVGGVELRDWQRRSPWPAPAVTSSSSTQVCPATLLPEALTMSWDTRASRRMTCSRRDVRRPSRMVCGYFRAR